MNTLDSNNGQRTHTTCKPMVRWSDRIKRFITRLKVYIADHQRDWVGIVYSFSSDLNTQVHRSTYTSPYCPERSHLQPGPFLLRADSNRLPTILPKISKQQLRAMLPACNLELRNKKGYPFAEVTSII